MTLRAGQKIREGDFINAAEKDPTPANNEDKVPRLQDDGRLHEDFLPVPVPPSVIVYDQATLFGSSTTRFDITKTGDTVRYTWDGTGTDPVINATTCPIGRQLFINGQNFNASNKGAFVVTGSGANYFEIENAGGVAEADKTLGTGAISFAYIKPENLLYVIVEVQGGGASGDDGGSTSTGGGGGGGGYARKLIPASSLAAYETLKVGLAGIYNGGRVAGGDSTFGAFMTASGAPSTSGGSATGGDINITGGSAPTGAGTSGSSGGVRQDFGGSSVLGNPGIGTSTDGGAATGYGAGGGGGEDTGGNGAPGVVIITQVFE